ncbi:hypothetical protein [Bulleidia sp. zg-1006]|uniref:hypothetical protein n=1 Tax=Bulleidia sp. zg-1006 TaxID=2806552 RepID=UPI00193A689E|nr:hypothetical protein [Bulleidia sp. zg-1006]QRG86055.1 hypothetical protein JOS54_04060 [Bulleidia sp. zg-1006]
MIFDANDNFEAKDKLLNLLRIGYSGAGTIFSAIRKGIHDWRVYDDKSLQSALKKHQGRMMKNAFVWDQLGEETHRQAETELTLDQKIEIKDFLKLCKKSGVNLLVSKLPSDYGDILEKANEDITHLTDREKRFVQDFCNLIEDEDNKPVVMLKSKDVLKFTFDSKDVSKVKRICDEMERLANKRKKKLDKKRLHLAELKKKAKEKYNSQKQPIPTKEKEMER